MLYPPGTSGGTGGNANTTAGVALVTEATATSEFNVFRSHALLGEEHIGEVSHLALHTRAIWVVFFMISDQCASG